MKSFAVLLALFAIISATNAFQPLSSTPSRRIKGENSKTSLDMTVLTYNGKKKNFAAGSPLKSAMSALGVKPKYSCTK
jgi:hypothetical protein